MHLKFKINWLFWCLFTPALQAQPEAFLSGPTQVRPGIGTGIQLTILRNGISGPVRYVQNLPPGWEAGKLPVFNAELSVESDQLRITWLNLPLRDTIHIAFELKIPEQNPVGNLYPLKGRLEYFEGRRIRQVEVKSHTLKTVKFFSRFQ